MFDTAPTFVLDDEPSANSAAADASATSAAPADDELLLDSYSRRVTAVVEMVGPSVVRLDIRRGDGQRAGSGSGVIVSPTAVTRRE